LYVHMCDVTHSYLGHDSLSLIHIYDTTHSHSCISMTRLILTHVCLGHDSFLLIHFYELTYSHLFISMTWLILLSHSHICEMTHGSFHRYEKSFSYLWMTWLMSHFTDMRMTYENESCHRYEWVRMSHAYLWHDSFSNLWNDSWVMRSQPTGAQK